jgi:hypothetical protein
VIVVFIRYANPAILRRGVWLVVVVQERSYAPRVKIIMVGKEVAIIQAGDM